MTELLWPWCLAIGWLLSFAAEALVHPRPKLPGRPLWTYLLHSGLWLLIFTVFLLSFSADICHAGGSRHLAGGGAGG
jgi:hypothetical protein